MINFFYFLRERSKSSNKFIAFLFYSFYRVLLLIYGSSIPLNTLLGKRLVFPHSFFGIFISGDAELGDDVTIYHQVTIGSVTTAGSKHLGAPKIGNGTIIGAGAKIIGGITIGENVKIGANCVVSENIPDGKTVVLSKPRVL